MEWSETSKQTRRNNMPENFKFFDRSAVMLSGVEPDIPCGRVKNLNKRSTLNGCVTPKANFHCLIKWFNQLFNHYVLNISVIQCIHLKKNSLMCGSSWDSCHFMKNLHFAFICNITQEPQELQRYNKLCLWVHWEVCCDKISSTAVKS